MTFRDSYDEKAKNILLSMAEKCSGWEASKEIAQALREAAAEAYEDASQLCATTDWNRGVFAEWFDGKAATLREVKKK